YLVPMAAEMPDIEIGHAVSPTADSELDAKGAGEAGTAGAPRAVMSAANGALRPLRAQPSTTMPLTPHVILRAPGRVSAHLPIRRGQAGRSKSAHQIEGDVAAATKPNQGTIKETEIMDIKVGRKAIQEATDKLKNWGRWGKDDQIGTLNHVRPEDIVK